MFDEYVGTNSDGTNSLRGPSTKTPIDLQYSIYLHHNLLSENVFAHPITIKPYLALVNDTHNLHSSFKKPMSMES